MYCYQTSKWLNTNVSKLSYWLKDLSLGTPQEVCSQSRESLEAAPMAVKKEVKLHYSWSKATNKIAPYKLKGKKLSPYVSPIPEFQQTPIKCHVWMHDHQTTDKKEKWRRKTWVDIKSGLREITKHPTCRDSMIRILRCILLYSINTFYLRCCSSLKEIVKKF